MLLAPRSTKSNRASRSPNQSGGDSGPWAWQWHQSGQELTQPVDRREWTTAKQFFDAIEEVSANKMSVRVLDDVDSQLAPYLYETITDGQWSSSSECPWRVDPRLMHTLRACLENFADDGMKLPPDAQEGYRRTIAGALGAWKDLPQYKECWESRPWTSSVDLPQMVRALCESPSSDESSEEDTELASCASESSIIPEIDDKQLGEKQIFIRRSLSDISEE
jgi:hypothetical protein